MKRRLRMGAISLTKTTTTTSLNFQSHKEHGHVVEQIPGLIKLYEDNHVERLPAVPDVPSTWSPDASISTYDLVINHTTGIWARFYVPRRHRQMQLPLLIYFHGGGFCVGSAAWACYHDFLSKVASIMTCVVMSVNYRLAPEHRLPAAYEDGLAAVKWARQQRDLNIDRIYLAGDSAGASIAYNVDSQLGNVTYLKGVILIQPFFGGEARTGSEKNSIQSSKSALTLSTSDCYWRMALPRGSDRDHPYCNPLGRRAPRIEKLKSAPMIVCVSELDILKDRNLEFCKVLEKAGGNVESVVYEGVGHAFQVLHNYNMSHVRTQELLNDVKAFVTKYRR